MRCTATPTELHDHEGEHHGNDGASGDRAELPELDDESRIRVLIVDDHQIFVESLTRPLGAAPDIVQYPKVRPAPRYSGVPASPPGNDAAAGAGEKREENDCSDGERMAAIPLGSDQTSRAGVGAGRPVSVDDDWGRRLKAGDRRDGLHGDGDGGGAHGRRRGHGRDHWHRAANLRCVGASSGDRAGRTTRRFGGHRCGADPRATARRNACVGVRR